MDGIESSVLSTPVSVASITRPMTGSSTDMTMNGIMMAITSVADMPGISAIGTVMNTAVRNPPQ